MATKKEELHELVDWLPEGLWEKAHKSLLSELKKADPVAYALYTAPEDDEEETEEERLAVQEAYEAIARGEIISHEDLMQELGLDDRVD